MIVCSRCQHQNADTDEFCQGPDCGAYLPYEGERRTPAAPRPAPPPPPVPELPVAQHQPAPEPPRVEPSPVPRRAARGYVPPPRAFVRPPAASAPPDRGLTASLAEPALEVAPGETVATTFRARNDSDVVDEYRLSVVGDPARWGEVEPPVLRLFPGAEGEAQVRFAPPRHSRTTAGTYRFGVKVMSRENVSRSTAQNGTLEVAAFHDLGTSIGPSASRGRRRGEHRISLENRGNAPAAVTLASADADEAIRLELGRGTLGVEPGRTDHVEVRVRARRLRWTGGQRTVPFRVEVTAADATEPVPLEATFRQDPLLPNGLGKALVTVAALAMGGLLTWKVALPHKVNNAIARAGTVAPHRQPASPSAPAGSATIGVASTPVPPTPSAVSSAAVSSAPASTSTSGTPVLAGQHLACRLLSYNSAAQIVPAVGPGSVSTSTQLLTTAAPADTCRFEASDKASDVQLQVGSDPRQTEFATLRNTIPTPTVIAGLGSLSFAPAPTTGKSVYAFWQSGYVFVVSATGTGLAPDGALAFAQGLYAQVAGLAPAAPSASA